MRLDSVREVKAGLLTRPREAALAGVPGRGVALGVHPAPDGEFLLAVRLQAPALDATAYVAAARGEADVRVIGPVRAFEIPWQRTRRRPLLPGVSVGHVDVTAGTLGCFVRADDGSPRMLSNNHVLADEDAARPGDPILQPGAFDGGRAPDDVVGRLAGAVSLSREEPNHVDAAVATVEVAFDAGTLTGVGTLSGRTLPPREAGAVAKVGRTTGVTRGRVTAFELDGLGVGYDRLGTLRFDDQVEVHGAGGPFSQGGDSGSLIVADPSGDAVALLFAGNAEGVTYANRIGAVLDALAVTLLS